MTTAPVQTVIGADQFAELVELARSLQTEADACAAVGHWRAALVLAGSAIEVAILASACALTDELQGMKLWPARGWADLSSRDLGSLIDIASRAGWLPFAVETPAADLFESLEGDLENTGEAVAFLRRVRNMATHPGRYVSEEVRPDFTDAEHMEPTYVLVTGIASAVLERLADAVGAAVAVDEPASAHTLTIDNNSEGQPDAATS